MARNNDVPFVSRNAGSNPFAGTAYEDLYANNPYADLYYEPTFWDRIGLSNKAKDANAEYERLYNEYVAGIYDQQRQDKYNSPSSEVERMREAGLNPDLQGLSGASNTDEMNPLNSGANPALNGQSPVMNAFQTITSVLSFATGTLNQIQQIKGLGFSNSQSKLGLFKSMQDLASDNIVSERAQLFLDPGRQEDWDSLKDVTSSALSRSERKLYSKAFSSLLHSSKITSSSKAYKDIADNDYAIQVLLEGMVKSDIATKLASNKSSQSKSNFESQYYSGLDSEVASSGTNRENANKSLYESYQNEMYTKLYKAFQSGNTLAGLILIGLGPSMISGASNIVGDLSKVFKLFKKGGKK